MAEARPTQRAYLFLEDQERFIRFLFTRPRTLIGSADDNDIVIRDPTVLPRHAEIYQAGDEYHLIAIAGGKTQVFGRPVEGVHVLNTGDPVQLGAVRILYAQETRMSDNTLNLIIERRGEIPFGVIISKPIVRLGRSKGDVLIDDDGLDPTHLLIENFCSDGVFVVDTKSRGGTFLNGQRLDGRRRLRDGDTLEVGTTKVQVGLTGASASAEPRSEAASYAPPAPSASRHDESRLHRGSSAPDPTHSSGSRASINRDPDPAPREAPSASKARQTEMVDVSDIPRARRPMARPAPDAPQRAERAAAQRPPRPERAAPEAEPDEAEPLPAYPDIATAGDFVGSRHYLPRSYRAGRTQDEGLEANWAEQPDETTRRRKPGQENKTTAIPTPARLGRKGKLVRDPVEPEKNWYHPNAGRKNPDDIPTDLEE